MWLQTVCPLGLKGVAFWFPLLSLNPQEHSPQHHNPFIWIPYLKLAQIVSNLSSVSHTKDLSWQSPVPSGLNNKIKDLYYGLRSFYNLIFVHLLVSFNVFLPILDVPIVSNCLYIPHDIAYTVCSIWDPLITIGWLGNLDLYFHLSTYFTL